MLFGHLSFSIPKITSWTLVLVVASPRHNHVSQSTKVPELVWYPPSGSRPNNLDSPKELVLSTIGNRFAFFQRRGKPCCGKPQYHMQSSLLRQKAKIVKDRQAITCMRFSIGPREISLSAEDCFAGSATCPASSSKSHHPVNFEPGESLAIFSIDAWLDPFWVANFASLLGTPL